MDEVLWAAAMVAALCLHLDILHSLYQVHCELFCNLVDAIGVLGFIFLLSLGAFPFQMCQAHGSHFRCQLVPLELP